MMLEDLQQIITGKSAKLAHRRLFLAVVAAAALVAVICCSMLIGLIVQGTRCSNPSAEANTTRFSPTSLQGVCTSSGCLQAAATIIGRIGTKATPCSNFYQFACGGWIERHSVPPDADSISVFDHLLAANEEKLRETLESPVRQNSSGSSERKMKEFFSLCVHDYGRMQASGRVLIGEMVRSLGGLYILSPGNWRDSWDLERALVTSHTDYGVPILFSYYVSPNQHDRRTNIIGVGETVLSWSPLGAR